MANSLNKSTQFIFYQGEDGNIKIQVIADSENETIWANQKSIAEIFNVESNTITYHLKNIYESEELTQNSTTRKIRVVQIEGNRNVNREIEFYNLDVKVLISIISILSNVRI